MPSDWLLHPQLARDTTPIGDLSLSRVLLMNDANYPWLLLVPMRHDMSEVIDLVEADQARLMTEVTCVSRALKDVTKCDKLNVAAIGNVVPQLHVHLIARHRNDAAWPRPVWGAVPQIDYDPGNRARLIAALRAKIWRLQTDTPII